MNKLVDLVWQNSPKADFRNPEVWGQDFAGAWIRKDQYGLRSNFGWVIDR